MSSRRRLRRQQPEEESSPIDPFGDLGPGDLGYRLRGGRSGLDPLDNATEQGRVVGMALKDLFRNPIARGVGLVALVGLLVSLASQGNWAGLGIIAAIVVGIFFLAAVSKQDLQDIRRRRER